MQLSRYDDHAAWFVSYTRDWAAGSAPHLPNDLVGARVLDLACGSGPLSQHLADRGAIVTGVELSTPLLDLALADETDQPKGIRYLHGDASTLRWWDHNQFEGVVCNMALTDIDDLDATITVIRDVLRPGGWFNISLMHPCFPGDARSAISTLPSWPPNAGYSVEGWWTTESTGVRGHVGANHRKLSTYLNAILDAGLEFTHLTEPETDLPRILIIDGRCPSKSRATDVRETVPLRAP